MKDIKETQSPKILIERDLRKETPNERIVLLPLFICTCFEREWVGRQSRNRVKSCHRPILVEEVFGNVNCLK